MREPDKKKLKRAMALIGAAIVSIENIKWEHRTDGENVKLNQAAAELRIVYRILEFV